VKYRWIIRENRNDSIIQQLTNSIGIPPSLARVLAARGVSTGEEAVHFLQPSLSELHDPFLMDGMAKAVERIEYAIAHDELIWIHGDYDVDGTTSTALLMMYLRGLGARVQYFIPDRQGEGYGLSTTSINDARDNNAQLIITVDCGITSIEAVRLAAGYGIESIICDHHEPAEELPNAVAILDPIKPGCSYPFKFLAACGVVFKLAQALGINRGEPERAFEYLDFVALASAADIVPLIGENRTLVHFGLKQLNAHTRSGFKALLDVAGIALSNVNTADVIFGLAPRINAAGRIGDAKRAVEMMAQTDQGVAFSIAQELERDNRRRRSIDETTFTSALKEAERLLAEDNTRRSIVLHKPDWHAGVIGIVASRLVEKFHLPVVMLTTVDYHAKGSARSIRNFDIHAGLKACEDLLVEFGGHKHAAGLTLEESKIALMRERFDNYAKENVTDEMLEREIVIDTELSLNELSPHFFRYLRQFAPFGHHNPKPIFYSRSVQSANGVKIVGNNHLKFRALQSNFVIDAIGFNLGAKANLCTNGKPFTIAYTLEENVYKGQVTPQLSIKDVIPDGEF
jgi:single-stranded-DNA-specific exonuclease